MNFGVKMADVSVTVGLVAVPATASPDNTKNSNVSAKRITAATQNSQSLPICPSSKRLFPEVSYEEGRIYNQILSFYLVVLHYHVMVQQRSRRTKQMADTPTQADKHKDLAKKKALEALLEETKGSVEEKVAALQTVHAVDRQRISVALSGLMKKD